MKELEIEFAEKYDPEIDSLGPIEYKRELVDLPTKKFIKRTT